MNKRFVGNMGISKNRGWFSPKMDGLFHGKAYEQMDDLGVPLPRFLVQHPYVQPWDLVY